ncbi:MAG: acyl-CoA dehydrogenase family protein [Pseudomonadales bacterium]|jgi:alkylation response protein AidB-like acyl-CoA dehydrogenase|nr:acyl-CoA dehydrogenase family protein [Pseudomonadales bacterium]MDP6470214.1 acyl-CoA dehydrogenase family protein [Pseudomonadales bacterium]MDP6827120.1 acyl-CoA dehydrogenase family protein [Pseudomonadales bacterium]MDP6971558.1 acyl-CoA dehydrogenase family protein [Pseudomonadales bacterium]|tara:strand:- start:1496 stop:2668 length:1173 start_codon:yes stop_codon:yes gene_type:complete
MRVELSGSQRAFREEVRDFLQTSLPGEIAARVRHNQGVGKEDLTRWTRILNERGWAAPNWSVEHGGTGWSLIERHLFDMECRSAHAPQLSGFGFNMVGPAIIRFGTDEQKDYFLPRILNADLWWCQGYSEPQAGSDLASLRTRAIREGDEYRVTGSKIWTSSAEHADWMFCLVRTNTQVQQQKGISFLLIDLDSPGVAIEPLLAFNGKRLWNQVFLEDVRVPAANRLGEEDRGWTVAKRLLGDERLMVSRVSENKRMLGVIRDVMGREPLPQGAVGQLMRELNALEIRLAALESTSLRLLTDADAGADIGAEPSMLKFKGSELVQAMDTLLFEVIGHWALPLDSSGGKEHPGPEYAEFVASGRYHHRGYTIAGGSSEVQHNIIAKQVLGL